MVSSCWPLVKQLCTWVQIILLERFSVSCHRKITQNSKDKSGSSDDNYSHGNECIGCKICAWIHLCGNMSSKKIEWLKCVVDTLDCHWYARTVICNNFSLMFEVNVSQRHKRARCVAYRRDLASGGAEARVGPGPSQQFSGPPWLTYKFNYNSGGFNVII